MVVLIHFAAPWELTDEKTGRVLRGWSLQFISPYSETRDGALGYRGTKTSIRDESCFVELAKLTLPVMAELVLEAKPDKDGKLTATVVGIKNPRPVQLFKPAQAAA